MNINVKTDKDIIHPYTYDSSNYKGFAEILYIPESFEELKEIVKNCYDNNVLITISGAGTGITGARVPHGGAVISMEKFKQIEMISDSVVKVGAAVTLDELDKYLSERNLFLPPNPTEINASIGGNLATNASGARTFKYGPIRKWVNKINAVLSDGNEIIINRGEVFSENYKLKLISTSGNEYKIQLPNYTMPSVKNASGYYTGESIDAIDMMIGAEGTLCIFTEIELNVIEKPANILGGIVFFDNNSKLIDFVIKLRDMSRINNLKDIKENEDLSARLIEYFDNASLNLLRPKYSEIPEQAVGAIWFEQEYHSEFEEILMTKWYEFIIEYTELSEQTWFALNEKEHLKLKDFRHELPLQVYENLTNNSQKKVGLDTAVPDDDFPELFKYYIDTFSKLNLENVVFGHIGNSHLHANIFCKNDEEYAEARKIYDKSIDLALSMKGTVSAEHGIGKLKKPYLEKMYGTDAINQMRNVKKVLDNKLILNIGTMFDI